MSQRTTIALLMDLLAHHAVLIGLGVRFLLAYWLPRMLDDEPRLLPGVAYTDIDYHVFCDAAAYSIIPGGSGSPYQRATYRYTPFLAVILAQLPAFRWSARYLFCAADALCGWLILQFRQQQRRNNQSSSRGGGGGGGDTTTNENVLVELPFGSSVVAIPPRLVDALWWLYNPLAINICTRGSAESFLVLLPVLVTVWICSGAKSMTTTTTTTTTDVSFTTTPGNNAPSSSSSSSSSRYSLWAAAALAGIWHGIAVHAKLYPIIYTVSFMTSFVVMNNRTNAPEEKKMTKKDDTSSGTVVTKQQPKLGGTTFVLLLWVRRLLQPAPVIFFLLFAMTFGWLTYIAYLWYGPVAVQQGLLYHFSRLDHRHNYSMHWYWIYLARAAAAAAAAAAADNNASAPLATTSSWTMTVAGRLLLVPQMLLLLYSSLGVAPHNLGLALFVQTFLFVAHNKVITAQYFTWYLCLLPLCSDSFAEAAAATVSSSASTKRRFHRPARRRVGPAVGMLLASIVIWLASAYCLEMQGMAVHRILWMASLFFFVANVKLLGALLSAAAASVQPESAATARVGESSVSSVSSSPAIPSVKGKRE